MLPIATVNGQQVDLFTTLIQPNSYALLLYQKVMNVSGYQGPQIYLFASYAIENAAAASKPIYQAFQPHMFSHFERYIVFNPNFMKHMEFSSGSEFTALAILAHELGHHFYSHCDNVNPWLVSKHPWDKEIEADYYSGYVLAKLGATPSDLETTQRLMFSMWDTSTHPDSFKRISSIVKGWKDGGGIGVAVDDLISVYNKLNNELNRWNHLLF